MAGTVFSAMLALGLIGNVQLLGADWSTVGVLTGSLLVMVLIGFWEELVFRGYILQNMAEGTGMKTATIFSCVLYGLVHLANPNATLQP